MADSEPTRMEDLPAPVMAVCGSSGAGKTTLLESSIPALVELGLAVAVVKHASHGFKVDRPGKDSERLFAAGANVVVTGPDECFGRRHGAGAQALAETLAGLAADHDLVLVEGHKGMPLPKVWLAGDHEGAPAGVSGVRAVLPPGDRTTPFLELVRGLVSRHLERRARIGGILVGGASSRMGQPKPLVEYDGRTLLEWAVTALEPHVGRLLLLGGGEVGGSEVERLPDVPGLRGPLAGILSGLRWARAACWLVAACDLTLSAEAVGWLMEQRRPGAWAVLPVDPQGRLQPLAAVYEPQARPLLEALVAGGRTAPRDLADHPKVITPRAPDRLAGAFRNLNAPEDLVVL